MHDVWETKSLASMQADLLWQALAWYYAKNNERHGPVALADVRRLLASGNLQPTDLVWAEHLPGWVAAKDVHEIAARDFLSSIPGLREPAARTPPAKAPALASRPAASPTRSPAPRQTHEQALLDQAARQPTAPATQPAASDEAAAFPADRDAFPGPGRTIVINHPPVQRWSPGLAAVLSFFVPGLGQLYKGQILNGIVWFFVVGLGYMALILPGLLLHFFCVIGAASGNPWTEGKTTVVRE